MLVIEDLHWADAPMIEFLEHVATWSEGVPILGSNLEAGGYSPSDSVDPVHDPQQNCICSLRSDAHAQVGATGPSAFPIA